MKRRVMAWKGGSVCVCAVRIRTEWSSWVTRARASAARSARRYRTAPAPPRLWAGSGARARGRGPGCRACPHGVRTNRRDRRATPQERRGKLPRNLTLQSSCFCHAEAAPDQRGRHNRKSEDEEQDDGADDAVEHQPEAEPHMVEGRSVSGRGLVNPPSVPVAPVGSSPAAHHPRRANQTATSRKTTPKPTAKERSLGGFGPASQTGASKLPPSLRPIPKRTAAPPPVRPMRMRPRRRRSGARTAVRRLLPMPPDTHAWTVRRLTRPPSCWSRTGSTPARRQG